MKAAAEAEIMEESSSLPAPAWLTLLFYTITLFSLSVVFVFQEHIHVITVYIFGGLALFFYCNSLVFLEINDICVRRLNNLFSFITKNYFKVRVYYSLYNHYLFKNIWTVGRFHYYKYGCYACLHMDVCLNTSVYLCVCLCTAGLQYSQMPKEGVRF